MPARGPPRARQANPRAPSAGPAAARRHPGQGRPARGPPPVGAIGRGPPPRGDAVGRGGRRRASGALLAPPLTPALASPQSGVALLPPPPGIDAGTWSAALAAAWGSRPPWSPSTPGGASGVSADVVALGSAALLTPAKDDDEPDADDDDAWESVPAPGDDDGGDGATKEEAKDGDDAKKGGDKEEGPHRSRSRRTTRPGTALFGAAHVDTDECLDSALASASVAGCAVDFAAAFVDDAAATRATPAATADRVFRGGGTGSKTFSQDALPSAVGAFKVDRRGAVAEEARRGARSVEERLARLAAFACASPPLAEVLAAHPACNDKEKERLVVAALAGGIRVPERKGPPLIRAKVVAVPPPPSPSSRRSSSPRTRRRRDDGGARRGLCADRGVRRGRRRDAAVGGDVAPARPAAQRAAKATATVNKLGAAASSSTSVGELLLSPTKTKAPGVARGSLEESYLLWLRASARGAKLAPNSSLPETLRDGSALCALLRHLNLPAMNNDASVVDNDPKSTEQAIANFALALGALRKSGKLDNGFYVDAGFSTGARLYGALSRDVAAKSNERSVALLGAVFKAHVAKLRLGGACSETDAFSKHVALAFADGARLKTLLYHFVGDAGLEAGGRAPAPAGRAARTRPRSPATRPPRATRPASRRSTPTRARRRSTTSSPSRARSRACGSGRGLADALTMAGGDAAAAAARLDFALLQLRELHCAGTGSRGSPAQDAPVPAAAEEAARGFAPAAAGRAQGRRARAAAARDAAAAARATPLRSGTKPPWALGAE
ncbi:hypothetical protein JL722_6734 [Aureococcus anophagefferens]|nr:hypothetical protein JL722_6734 [Aureococcus anophagefferens]